MALPNHRGVAGAGVTALAALSAIATVALSTGPARTWLVPGGARGSELLGAEGGGGGQPWVLGGGGGAALAQMRFDRQGGLRAVGEGGAGQLSDRARKQELLLNCCASKYDPEAPPDDPHASRIVWRKYVPDKSPFDDLEVKKYNWKSEHEPEFNVFDNITEAKLDNCADGCDAEGQGEESASFSGEGAATGSGPAAGSGSGAAAGSGSGAAFAGGRRSQLASLAGRRGRVGVVRDGEAERVAEAEGEQLRSVRGKLRAARKKIQLLERDGGHVWQKQRPIMNVLDTAFPTKEYKWHQNREVLPDVWANLDTSPVVWHKYREEKPTYIGFLPQGKKVAWKPQKPEANVLASSLPSSPHKWVGRRPDEGHNALGGLDSSVHKWRPYKGEQLNVLGSLDSGTHKWGKQSGDVNVLDGLSSEEHRWRPYKGIGKNVLDALPSGAYVWGKRPLDNSNVLAGLPSKKWEWKGPGLEEHHQLDALRVEKQRWHSYMPDRSPLSSLPDRQYKWKGYGGEGPTPLASLDSAKYQWRGYAPEKSPMDALPDAKYTWKGYKPEGDGLKWPEAKKWVWRGPGKEDAVHLSGLGEQRYQWKGPGKDPNPLAGLDTSKHVWRPQQQEANVLGYLPTDIPDAGEKA